MTALEKKAEDAEEEYKSYIFKSFPIIIVSNI